MKVEITHPEKIVFPGDGITKKDLVTYYEKIAPFLLPHVKNHLIVLHRFVNGIQHEGFYQKQAADYFPEWLKRATIDLKKGDEQTLVLLEKPEDLMYLANQAVIVFHSWLSEYKKPDYPTKIVFDLDPSGDNIEDLHFAAEHVKDELEKQGLVPFLMTTGSRGYHVVAPIKPDHSFDVVRDFVKNVADELAFQHSDVMTTEMSKQERAGRVFVDYLRNSYGATSVAPYSLRAKDGAPVATPLEWNELHSTEPDKYTLKNIFRRLARKGDVWKDFEKSAKKLKL